MPVVFGPQGIVARTLLVGEIDGLAAQAAQAGGVPIGEVGRDRDPLPALGAKGFRFGLELLDDQAVEQGRVLEPAAIVMLEQVAQHDATGRFIGVDADEPRALVGGADRAFGKLAADVIRLLVVGASERFPNLLLARMVVGDRERHQLLQRHAVLGIDVEELVGHGRELQPLLDDGRVHEEPGGDLLFAQPLLAQGLEGAKLVERVQGDALHVLGQRILFAEAALPHHARHGLGLGHPLLLHQQFERPEAAATGRHLEHAGLLALRVRHGPDAQALQERAPGDVLGQLLDGDSGLYPAHIGLAEHQLVEGNVARGAEGDLLNGGCHVDILRDGRPKASLSTSNPSRRPAQPSHSRRMELAGAACCAPGIHTRHAARLGHDR